MNKSTDPLRDYYLSFEMPPEHRDALAYLIDWRDEEPENGTRSAMKRATRPFKEQALGVLVTEWYGGIEYDSANLLVAHYADSKEQWSVGDDDSAKSAAVLFARLLKQYKRSYLFVVYQGHDVLPGLLVSAKDSLLKLGYTIQVIGAYNSLRAFIVRKGQCTWKFASDTSVFGQTVANRLSSSLGDPLTIYAGVSNPAVLVYQKMHELSTALSECLGTSVQMTLGLAAMKAARQHWPEKVIKHRPRRLLRAFLREGKGYRGGYAYSTRYHGYAEKADITLAYSSLLAKPLPLSHNWGYCSDGVSERNGCFICTVEGKGSYPVSAGMWDAREGRFRSGNLSDTPATAILLRSEFDGIRALGYTVVPSAGFAWQDNFTLAALTDSITAGIAKYGRDTDKGKLVKAVGNACYGKFGERAERLTWLVSQERPNEKALPALNERGFEYPDLWVMETVLHRAHHLPDIAAEITALCRNQVYLAMAALTRLGVPILHVVTDSIMATNGLEEALDCQEEVPGEWRFEGSSCDTSVLSAGRYEYNGQQRVAGVTDPPPNLIRRLVLGKEPHLVQEHSLPTRLGRAVPIRLAR